MTCTQARAPSSENVWAEPTSVAALFAVFLKSSPRREEVPRTRLRLRRKRRTLARLPHACISHQRLFPLRLLSTNSQEQVSPEHWRTRVKACDVRRSAADRMISCETRSRGSIADH